MEKALCSGNVREFQRLHDLYNQQLDAVEAADAMAAKAENVKLCDGSEPFAAAPGSAVRLVVDPKEI